MKKTAKSLRCFLMAAIALCVLSGAALAEDIGYLPLRDTFEGIGCEVAWYSETPEDIFVRIGDQMLMFKNHANVIITDEGIFHTARETYIKDGRTYVSEDALELVKNINLYHNAIEDCETMEASELHPLFAIDDTADKVLVCTWHRYPETYVEGETVTISHGQVWVTVADEILNSGDMGSGDAFILRMEQLIGLPPQKHYSHFTLMWVDPKDIFRPAQDSSVNKTDITLGFPEGTDEAHKQWFYDNQKYSYTPHRYPWTGMGYTYDWADNGTEYGYSEYIVRDGAVVSVEKTYTNTEFENLLRQGAN